MITFIRTHEVVEDRAELNIRSHANCFSLRTDPGAQTTHVQLASVNVPLPSVCLQSLTGLTSSGLLSFRIATLHVHIKPSSQWSAMHTKAQKPPDT